MAEADGAETETLCGKNVGEQSSVDEQVETKPQKPRESKGGEEEGHEASSQVFKATSLPLQPETEKPNSLTAHPLVRRTHRSEPEDQMRPYKDLMFLSYKQPAC